VSGEVVVAMPAGDPAALDSGAAQLAACAAAFEDLITHTGQVTTAVADRSDWTGSAADGYRQFSAGMVKSAGGIPVALREICSAIRGYAETLAAAQQQVTSAVQDANSASVPARPAAVASAMRVAAVACDQAREGAQAAVARVNTAKSGLAGLWDGTEPGRKVVELVLAPFDIVAADHWIDLLKELAGQPTEWLKDLDDLIAEAKGLREAGLPAVEKLIAAGGKTERTGAMLDAWQVFSPGWLRAAARSISEIRGLSSALTGLGLVADASDAISPQDHGVMATIDRLAAGANATGLILHQGIERGLVTFKPAGAGGAGADGAEASAEVAIEGAEASEAVDGGLIALNASLDWIPVAGEVVIVGTGVYLAGDALYHWKPFRDVADAVGHATVRVVDDGVGKIEHGMDSFVSSLTDWGSF
jgi:uncharacterized protein YukE